MQIALSCATHHNAKDLSVGVPPITGTRSRPTPRTLSGGQQMPTCEVAGRAEGLDLTGLEDEALFKSLQRAKGSFSADIGQTRICNARVDRHDAFSNPGGQIEASIWPGYPKKITSTHSLLSHTTCNVDALGTLSLTVNKCLDLETLLTSISRSDLLSPRRPLLKPHP